MVAVITIPQKLSKQGDLVLIPRQEYEAILRALRKEEKVSEKDVLRWAKEAEKMADRGRLPVLRSLKDLR